MATTVDTLVTKYKLDDADYQAGASRVQTATQRVGSAISGPGMTVIKAFAASIGAVGLALAGLAVASSRKAAEFEAIVKALEAVVGSAEAARESIEKLRDIAKLPGLGFQEAVQGYTQLRRSGLDDSTSMRLIRAAGNANALASGGQEELGRILRAFMQIAVKPRLQGEELLQLTEAGVPGYKMLKDAFGTADTEQLAKRGIDATEVIQAMIIQMEKMPKAGESAKNALENASMAVDEAMVAIGTGFNVGMAPFLNKVSSAVAELSESGALEAFGDSLWGLVSSIIPTGIEEAEGMNEAMISLYGAMVVVTEMTRNFTINIKALVKMFDMFSPAPEIMDSLSGPGLSPLDLAEQEMETLRMQMQLRRKRRKNRAKSQSGLGGEDSLSAESPVESPIPFLREIARNTEQLLDIQKGIVGGSILGEAALNAVNINRITGGGRSRGSYLTRAVALIEAGVMQGISSSRSRV